MNFDENRFICFVQDEEGTSSLGKFFGSEILLPFVNSSNSSFEHFVIFCYGIPMVGKTKFFENAAKLLTEKKEKIFFWDRYKREEIRVNGCLFRYADFGAFVNPVELDDCHEGILRKKWVWTSCEVPVFPSTSGKSLSFFEHPSLPHLLFNYGVSIIFGYPLEARRTGIYLDYFSGLVERVNLSNKKFEQLSLCMKEIKELSVKLYRAKITDPIFIDTGDERYIGFVLMSKERTHKEAFLRFREKAKEFVI